MVTGKNRGRIIIECPQRIPCNPCVDICSFGAIHKECLNAIPVVDDDKCKGCMLCVAACPGQAIFYVQEDASNGIYRATFPYEYLPLPQIGQIVICVDAEGRELGEGWVEAVIVSKIYNATPLVTVGMHSEAGLQARSFRRGWEETCNEER